MGVVCFQEKVLATGLPLVQWSPAECGVSECDLETSIIRAPLGTRSCCAMKMKCKNIVTLMTLTK